ncbi:hypothetical protein [Kitasatospora sp. NPDC059327]|uniref:hypothetical protein n=1 Tax=Kitasatospora sp. NPDC059327 TaxID=3346803 RepID=UPI0036AE7E38
MPFSRPVLFSRLVPGASQGLPSEVHGTVRISHHLAALDGTVTPEGPVACPPTGGRTAWFGVVATRVDPEAADTVGRRQGFSSLDGGSPERPDRCGFSWSGSYPDTDATGRFGGSATVPGMFLPRA